MTETPWRHLAKAYNPAWEQDFRETDGQLVCCFQCEWVSLSPVFVHPCWILWSGTSGFTNCRGLLLHSHGYSGEIPFWCIWCCSFFKKKEIAVTIQLSTEIHIHMFGAKKLQLGQNPPTSLHITAHVTVCVPLNLCCFPSCQKCRRRRLCVLWFRMFRIIQHALNESLGVYVLVQGQMWPHVGLTQSNSVLFSRIIWKSSFSESSGSECETQIAQKP